MVKITGIQQTGSQAGFLRLSAVPGLGRAQHVTRLVVLIIEIISGIQPGGSQAGFLRPAAVPGLGLAQQVTRLVVLIE